MSRRFGRNQRRRAREEIARLEAERQEKDDLVASLAKSTQMHSARADALAANRDRLAAQLAHLKGTVEEVLGPGFVGLEAGLRLVTNPGEFESMSECMHFHVEQGVGFRVSAEVDQCRRAMHVMLRCGRTERMSYVLSETAIAKLSRERLAEMLQRQVGPLLVREVVKALKR